MLPPLGLSLTSVTLRVDRLFCLEVFSHLPPCMPATPEMIPSSSSLEEEASSEAPRAPNMRRGWGGLMGGGFPKAPLFDVEN